MWLYILLRQCHALALAGLLESPVCWLGRPRWSPSSCPLSCSEVRISMFQVSSKFCQMSVCSLHIDWNFNMLKTCSSAKIPLNTQHRPKKGEGVARSHCPIHRILSRTWRIAALQFSLLFLATWQNLPAAWKFLNFLIQNGTGFFSRETTSLRMNTLGVHNPGALNSLLKQPAALITHSHRAWNQRSWNLCRSCPASLRVSLAAAWLLHHASRWWSQCGSP